MIDSAVLSKIEFDFPNKTISVLWTITENYTVKTIRRSYVEGDLQQFKNDFGKNYKKFVSLIW